MFLPYMKVTAPKLSHESVNSSCFIPFLLFCLQVICQRATWHISGSRTRQKSKHCFCLVFRSYNETGVPDSYKRFRSTPFWKKLETIDSTAPAVCGFSDQPTSATLVQRKLVMAQHGTRSGLMQKKVQQSTWLTFIFKCCYHEEDGERLVEDD